jgi:hypothetical protein
MMRVFLAAVLAATISGCQTVTTDYDHPARIINPDEASRAALRSVVNSVLNTAVTLADSALTDTSLLTIERNPPRTMANPTPQGRIMEMPIQFLLVVNDTDCILIDQRDRTRHILRNTNCEAE